MEGEVNSKFNEMLWEHVAKGCNAGGVDEELREKLVAVRNEVENQLLEFMRLRFFLEQRKIELPNTIKKDIKKYKRSIRTLWRSVTLELIDLGCLDKQKVKKDIRTYSKRAMVLGSTLRDIQREVADWILANIR
ncbi:MAG: hypothetical protein JHC26_05265 [Thermofilum sp.]|jgi:hypothetical protein|uniref:hypothetical protein n=1 Tax=Thermofilum sp. TaxID=1961369 RepID=UPI00258419A0|nr:hypothetical protein [Thermofilum sp.]MCI4408480.1 hypothetical protein [Thermofilum sp.]